MAEKKPVEVTYGDLVNGDTIVDKSGNEWAVLAPVHQDGTTTLRLADPKTPTIPVHTLTKPATDAVTVLRVHVETQAEEVERREAEMEGPWDPPADPETQAEEVERREAEMPRQYGHARDGRDCVPEVCGTGRQDPCSYSPEQIAEFDREAEAERPNPYLAPTTAEEAVEAVAEVLGGETVAEETAAEADARKTAGATGEPVELPLFSAMSMLEKKSHLYLLHGVFAHDVKTMGALDELHAEAEEKAPAFPHVHAADAKVEVS